MKPMRMKIRSSIMLAVVLCSALVNMFSAAPSANAAPAAPAPTDPATLYIAPEVLTDATASEYRTSLALCLTGDNNDTSTVGTYDMTSNVGDQISAQDAATGNWFTNDYTTRPGILVWGKADDSIDCSDLFKYGITQALGAPDNITLACAVGLTRVDGKDCLSDPQQSNFQQTSNSTDRNKIYAALDKLRTNASAPPTGGWNDAQMYVDVMQSLTSFCQAVPKANVGGPLATPVIQAQYNNIIDVVDGTGQITKVYYDIPNAGNKLMLENFPDNFHYWELSCGDLVAQASRYAPGYSAYVKAHPQSTSSAGSGSTSNSGPADKTSCNIQGIGWVVCPVMRFMAQVTDYAYGVVSDMLTTPALDTSTSSPMYTAWSIMRNFANVAFVIAFLLIIYSQITGVGISNYGIKKLLPRIVVAAILVNISYWICAIAIDISNILGVSLKGLIEGVSNQLFQSGKGFSSSGAGGGWDALTVGLITGVAVAAALYAGLSVLVPLLIAALISIITIVIILTVRQALIVLLTVISPLAFVAYLLPNTEKWFHKWRELYQDLLLLFPIVAILFGACKLASTVLMNDPSASFTIKVMAAGITVVPLLLTPMILKTSTNILGKIGGFTNKGPFNRMRQGAAGYRQNRQEYRKLKALTGYRTLPGRGIMARRGAQRQAVLNNRKAELNRANSAYISGLAQENDSFRGKLAQGGAEGSNERALAQAINIQANLRADELKAAQATIKEANLEGDLSALQQLATGGSVTYTDRSGQTRTLTAAQGSTLQTAAITQQFKNGDVKMTDQLVMGSGSMGVEQRQAVADGMASLSKKVRYYGGSSGDAVAKGEVNSAEDLNKIVAKSINDGKYSAEILANSDKDSLERIANVAADPVGTTAQKDAAGNAIPGTETALDSGRVTSLKDSVQEIASKDTIKNPDSRTQERLDAIDNGVRFSSNP